MGIVIESHIHLDDNGVAWIVDANTKVIEVVLDQLAYGFRTYEAIEIALYHTLGDLPEPNFTHEF